MHTEDDEKTEGVEDLFENKKSALRFLFELLQIAAISLAIIIPVRYFLIQPFYVKGASMEPNFFDHEYLIIDELSFRLRPPERGDVVVFRYPNDPRQFFIKRVVGLPGETVEIAEGVVKIFNDGFPNGFILPEDEYLRSEFTSTNRTMTGRLRPSAIARCTTSSARPSWARAGDAIHASAALRASTRSRPTKESI